MKNKKYNSAYLRQHFASGISVSNDGMHAERKTSKGVYTYQICREESGRTFIRDSYKGAFYLDEIVLTCYRGQAPKDGKKYFVYHKDGDMGNAHISNLEWREDTAAEQEAFRKLQITAWYKRRKIKVLNDGTIKRGNNELPLLHSFYDSDTDWLHHRPDAQVEYEYTDSRGYKIKERIAADKIFEDFGFVNGNKSHYPNPVILHRNNKYLDYSAGNLEWCNASDERYKEFDKIRHDDVMQKDHDCNCRLDERSWNVIYNGREPFQDWTDRPEKKLYRFY